MKKKRENPWNLKFLKGSSGAAGALYAEEWKTLLI